MRLRSYHWWLTLLPISVGSYSVNYSIALFALKGPFLRISAWGALRALALLVYILCYFHGLARFSGFEADFMLRQLTSLGVFLSVFGLLYLNINNDPEEIAWAAVVVAAVWSLWAWAAFSVAGISLADPYGIKAQLRDFVPDWPQRYIVIVSFCAVFLFGLRQRGMVVIALLIVLLLTVFLSFTRAAWAGTVCGLIGCLLAEIRSKRGARRVSVLRRLLPYGVLTAIVFAMISALGQEGGTHVVGVAERIVDAVGTLGNPTHLAEGSDRERFAIWVAAISIVEQSPWFGTGFAGIYLFPGDVGSTHSQYVDMFLRTGLLGLALFLVIFLRTLVYYWRASPAIFGGLIAIAVIGFAHETVKLSYVGVLFFSLASIALSRERAPQTTFVRAPLLKPS